MRESPGHPTRDGDGYGSLGERLRQSNDAHEQVRTARGATWRAVVLLTSTLIVVAGSALLCTIALVVTLGLDDAFGNPLYYVLSVVIPLVLTPIAVAYYLSILARNDALTIAYRELAEEYRSSAEMDQLTGVLNRRGLFDRLASVPDGTVVALCDVDGFKAINDTHGHQAGDAALVSVARALVERAGPHGTVARTGGDEFVIVHPAGSSGAVVNRLAVPCPTGTVWVSVGGIVAAGEVSLDRALALADARMYESKMGSRGVRTDRLHRRHSPAEPRTGA